MKLRFGKWDALAVVGVVALAALVFALLLPQKEASGGYAQIYQEGKLIQTLSLSTEQEFTVNGVYTATVTVRDGKVAVTRSDCPGGDCLRCGWLDSTGRSIVCLPGSLEIRVVGESGDVDFVVG